MPYFDLKVMRSYKTNGFGNVRYHFYKDTPTEVNETDAIKFRQQPEIFIEVDEKGHAIVVVKAKTEARSIKKFRDFGDEPEDVLDNAFKTAVEQRVANPVDISSLLAQVQADAIISKPNGEIVAPAVDEDEDEDEDEEIIPPVADAPVVDGTITTASFPKQPRKKKIQ